MKRQFEDLDKEFFVNTEDPEPRPDVNLHIDRFTAETTFCKQVGSCSQPWHDVKVVLWDHDVKTMCSLRKCKQLNLIEH